MRKRVCAEMEDDGSGGKEVSTARLNCLSKLAHVPGGQPLRIVLALPLVSTLENGLDQHSVVSEVIELLFQKLKVLWEWWCVTRKGLKNLLLQLQVAVVDEREDVRVQINKVCSR
jgi:hypothetical protein